MMARIDLVWIGEAAAPPAWPLGAVISSSATPRALHDLIERDAAHSSADAWLFWDSALGEPSSDRTLEAIGQPGDIWHSGLELGLAGAPGMIDFVTPTWTFNRDPDASRVATSWRVTLRACLVRTSVLRWALPNPLFDSLDGMSLEWGHRCIHYGALPRYFPRGIHDSNSRGRPCLTLADELRFARAAFGTRWASWATLRAALTHYAPFETLADAWLVTRGFAIASPTRPYAPPSSERKAPSLAVSVLIPTLDRYEYLRTLLRQFGGQTVPAAEVIVVDQTPRERRDRALASEFSGLPITLIELDAVGQCTARNSGLLKAHGDAILFIDDDEEIEPDLIARHLANLTATGADVSSGVAQEPTSGPLPDAFTRPRASDVFPTGNTLAKRSALERSGLFDLAYDHGARADGDLGMRAYLSGAVMMLAPSITVLHHHAPRGGLRTHGTRVVTYATSRRRITQRQLLEVTDVYRALRYFSARHVREALIQSALGTLSAHGGPVHRALKVAYGLAVMPHTLWQLRRRLASARKMLERYPQIPLLPPRAP